MAYFDRANTRVAILNSVAILGVPSVAELNAGYDISSRLTADGLRPNGNTVTEKRTPWKGGLEVEVPVRRSMSFLLQAYRNTTATTDMLWTISRWRSNGVLVVRRGVAVTTAWTAGQAVESYRFTFGLRNHLGSGSATTFIVPLLVYEMEDQAVVS